MKTPVLATLLALFPGVALAQSMPGMPGMSQGSMAASPADRAYAATMESMRKGMDGPMSGNADKDFVRMMIAHHQGAIDMAKVELQYGKDPTLRRLAEDIIKAQAAELGQMREWQAKNDKEARPPG